MWLGAANIAKIFTSRIIAAEASTTGQSRRRGLQPDIEGLDEVSPPSAESNEGELTARDSPRCGRM